MKALLLIALIGIAQAATWNYAQHGADWSTHTPLCGTGLQQSPINIVRASVTIDSTTLTLKGDYSGKSKDKDGNAIGILNTGYALKVSADFGKVKYNNKTYKMLQFHWHQPSEHTIDGNYYDSELHCVHQVDSGAADFLVIGYLFQLGQENNSFFTDVKYNAASSTTDAKTLIGKSVNPWDQMTKLNDQWAYTYPGSFTTPPCTEGVNWFVMREVGTLSRAQWDAYKAALPNVSMVYATGNGSYRITQNLNARAIYLRKVIVDNEEYLTAGQIAGIVVGSVCGFLILLGLGYMFYYFDQRKKDATLNKTISEKPANAYQQIDTNKSGP